MDNSLGPWFPDLPVAGHHLLHQTQLSPGTAPTRKSHKILHFLLSLLHPHLHCPKLSPFFILQHPVGQVVFIPVLEVKTPTLREVK